MRLYLFILVIISVTLLFFHLGSRPFLSSGEARASGIAIEMLKRGDLLIPYLNEEILLTKPPLFHWIIVLSYKLFGVSEFSSRVPSALAGVFTVILVYLLGKRFWDKKTGFIAGLVLATSPIFFWSARCARIDSLLLLLITMSLYCFWRGWFLGWFLFMGLGVLTKGPIGVVVPLGTAIMFLVFTKKKNLFRKLNWFWGLLLFFIIVSPWFVMIYFLAPQAETKTFFVQQNWAWLTGGGEWYKGYVYLPHLFLGFFPWSLILPAALIFTWKKKDEKIIFLWTWMLLVFFIFFFTGKKVGRYILPLYPAVSLLTAATICNKKGINRIFPFAIAISFISLIMFIIYFIPIERDYYSPKPFCEMLKKEIPQGVSIYAYKSWDNSIRYYFGRHVDVIEVEGGLSRFLNSKEKAYCIMWEDVYNKLPEDKKDRIFIVKTGYKVLEHKTILVSNRK